MKDRGVDLVCVETGGWVHCLSAQRCCNMHNDLVNGICDYFRNAKIQVVNRTTTIFFIVLDTLYIFLRWNQTPNNYLVIDKVMCYKSFGPCRH